MIITFWLIFNFGLTDASYTSDDARFFLFTTCCFFAYSFSHFWFIFLFNLLFVLFLDNRQTIWYTFLNVEILNVFVFKVNMNGWMNFQVNIRRWLLKKNIIKNAHRFNHSIKIRAQVHFSFSLINQLCVLEILHLVDKWFFKCKFHVLCSESMEDQCDLNGIVTIFG